MATPDDPWPNDDMEHTTPQAEASAAPQLPQEHTQETPYQRRLERIEDGKWIAGVATGLAEYFSVPTWLVRLIFIFLLAPAGLGVLTYLALVVFMPHESEDESPAERWFGGIDNPDRAIGIGLAAVAALVLLASTTAIDGGAVVALALLGVGVVLYQRGTLGGSKASRDVSAHDAKDAPSTSDAEETNTGGRPPRPPREPRATQPREPKPPKAPRAPKQKSNLGAYTFATMLMALGLLGTADITDVLAPKAFHYVAVAISVVGLGLLVGAWRGRSRGLILLGLAMLPALGITWVTGNVDTIVNEWERLSTSENVHQNETFVITDVEGREALNLGVGEVTVDLTDANFAADAQLDIRMDAGQLTVIVPNNVRVRADLDLGQIESPGRDLDGIDVSTTYGPSLGDADGYITVRLDVGQIVIVEGN